MREGLVFISLLIYIYIYYIHTHVFMIDGWHWMAMLPACLTVQENEKLRAVFLEHLDSGHGRDWKRLEEYDFGSRFIDSAFATQHNMTMFDAATR